VLHGSRVDLAANDDSLGVRSLFQHRPERKPRSVDCTLGLILVSALIRALVIAGGTPSSTGGLHRDNSCHRARAGKHHALGCGRCRRRTSGALIARIASDIHA